MSEIFDPRDEVATVGGSTKVVSANFTRPNDINAYTAGNVVSDDDTSPTVITFSECARGRGLTGVIANAQLLDSANQATKADLELWLFSAAPTAMEDNAAFDPTDAELADRVGIIDFGSSPDEGNATAGAGGNCMYQQTNLNIVFACAAGAADLYGVLVVRNAYTPVAEEVFTVILGILQD